MKLQFSSLLSFFLFGILFFVISACSSTNAVEEEIAKIPVDITLDRFDQKFFNASKEDFYQLKQDYPYLFPEQYPDSIWQKRQRDSLQVLLQGEISKVYPSLAPFEKQLKPLFQHIKYYFPRLKDPKVILLTNNVDYQNKTVYADSLVLISLDTFLGANNPLYEGIPQYIVRDMDIAYLGAHLSDEFAISVVPAPADRTLLAQMIYYGKRFYIKDILLPDTADEIKISYTEKEMNWVKENERFIWQYFIENELLYKTQSSYLLRFIEPAPFSKFYLEIDNESPGKIGQWLGWQIVRAFVSKNPDKTPEQILATPAQELFTKANYKPAK
ncbi:MAG: gliding motility lipoprotein GldB [Flavobacteriaceae bacterium]|nr:gliding motility lipoprotein GldB [Flavobacteriaceae bacterium]